MMVMEWCASLAVRISAPATDTLEDIQVACYLRWFLLKRGLKAWRVPVTRLTLNEEGKAGDYRINQRVGSLGYVRWRSGH